MKVLAVLVLLVGLAHAQPARPHLELPQQNLTDGQNITVIPITVTDSRAERDRRPMFIGAGIVVLAAVFWWNRKRRESWTDEARADDRDEARGDDSDDLRAAARGDETKDKA